jgi:hypothetical protein
VVTPAAGVAQIVASVPGVHPRGGGSKSDPPAAIIPLDWYPNPPKQVWSMYTTWEICFTVEGKLDIFKNGERVHRGVPIVWLERQLALYGICDEDYKKVVDQLSDVGKASVRLSPR